MKQFKTKLVLISLLILLPAYVYACSTPVFRYALERWPADFYDGVLVHRGPIPEDHPAGKLFEDEKAAYLNLRLTRLDLDSAEEEDVKKLLGEKVPEKLPALVLWYPWQKGRAAPFWSGEFKTETVEPLIHSATRKEVAKRLSEGQAGVWIFVESGDKPKDKAALQLLQKELKNVTKELMEYAPPIEQTGVPSVSYDFSTVSISRNDPNERMLLSMIMNSEPDLDEYVNEPMAVPVFGRGRVLYTLVGEGINTDNIRESAAFLTGPCGCEIKMMNPGVDLLMAVDWDGAVMEMYEEFYASAEEEELPELTSVFPDDPEPAETQPEVAAQTTGGDTSEVSPPAETEKTEPVVVEDESGSYLIGVNRAQVEVAEDTSAGGSLGVMGMAAISLGGLVLVAVLGTLAVSRRK
jgi:hypothetical protein